MKNITLLALTCSGLLLASCNRTTPPSNLTSVSGTLKEVVVNEQTMTFGTTAWTGGAGNLIAVADDGGEVARTALAADGSFTLSLPGTLAPDRLTALDVSELNDVNGCTGNVRASGQANAALASFSVDANKDGAVAPASFQIIRNSAGTPTGAKVTIGMLVYVDRSVTLRGNQTCTENGASVRLDVDWRLGQGWNKVSVSFDLNDSDTVGLNLTSGSLPADWLYLEGTGVASPLGAASLKGLNFKVPQLPFFR